MGPLDQQSSAFSRAVTQRGKVFFPSGAVCFSTMNSPSSLVSKHLAGLPCWYCLFVLLLRCCGGWEFGWPWGGEPHQTPALAGSRGLCCLFIPCWHSSRLELWGKIILQDDVAAPMRVMGRISMNDTGLRWGAQ